MEVIQFVFTLGSLNIYAKTENLKTVKNVTVY